MIHLDGTAGEGGGQVLRTALGLSLVTGKAFLIENIRGKRKRPGILRQHLTAIQAATEIGDAVVTGAKIASSRLTFQPQTIRPGRYHFTIGTAGSCTLVFQAVLPALLMAGEATEIVLEGGTHNPFAPSFDFLQMTFLPILAQSGVRISAALEKPGFYPAGGGRMRVTITPAEHLQPLVLTDCNNTRLSAEIICAELPSHIAEREIKIMREQLEIREQDIKSTTLDQYGPGNVVTVFVHSDQLTETFTEYGQKHLKAEKVALRAANRVIRYLQAKVPVGPHLADQLLLPLALAGKGTFRTCQPTQHTLTNIDIISHFLDVDIRLRQIDNMVWQVTV